MNRRISWAWLAAAAAAAAVAAAVWLALQAPPNHAPPAAPSVATKINPPPPHPAAPPPVTAPAATAGPAPQRPVRNDPAGAEMAARLHAADASPADDLQILDDLLRLHRRLGSGNPVGLNEDITATLTGHNDKRWAVIPPGHPAIRDRQLVDRWGSPYFFHALSGDFMELRSAGPDRKLFTADDLTQP